MIVIILLIVIAILALLIIYFIREQGSALSGAPKIILGEEGEQMWYENVVRHLMPNGEFIKCSRSEARDCDIVVMSWGTLWDKKSLGNKGYRLFINAEPFALDKIRTDLIIGSSYRNSPSIYLPYYAMTFLERKTHKISDLIHPIIDNTEREKFCIFMYSHCDVDFEGIRSREKLFDIMERVVGQSIDSPGKCKNNMSPKGSRWTDNVEIFKAYKFVIAVENSFLDGYITEKIINPFLAGCIPIYLGAPDISKHFNPARFINVRDFPDLESCANYVLRVHKDPKLFQDIQSAPLFTHPNPYLSWLESGVMYPELRDGWPDKLKPYLPLVDDISQFDNMKSAALADSETIHYINLDRSHERNESIITQASLKKIPLMRIPAYDGSLLNQVDDKTLIYGQSLPVKLGVCKRRLVSGEIGCYLSHMSVWLSLLRSKLDHLAIIEDDIIFDGMSSVSQIISTAPADWDILYLAYNPQYCKGMPSGTSPSSMNGTSVREWHRAQSNWQPCTPGYIINRRSALFLLKNLWPISRAIDEVINHYFVSLNAYICFPPVILIDFGFRTTIHEV